MGENIGSKIKSPGRRAMPSMMKAREVITRPTTHPQGSRTERRTALKSKRAAQRQASRKCQAVGVAVDARHRISGWARRLGDAVDVRAFGRWLDCVRQITISEAAAGSR